MIVGIGTDLTGMRRIEKAVLKCPAAFTHRILTRNECRVFHQRWGQSHGKAMRYLATRFAAKEAFFKAMTRIHFVSSWQDMEVINLDNGAPTIQWRGDSAVITGLSFHLSLTDEIQYAQAMVVIERTLE